MRRRSPRRYVLCENQQAARPVGSGAVPLRVWRQRTLLPGQAARPDSTVGRLQIQLALFRNRSPSQFDLALHPAKTRLIELVLGF